MDGVYIQEKPGGIGVRTFHTFADVQQSVPYVVGIPGGLYDGPLRLRKAFIG